MRAEVGAQTALREIVRRDAGEKEQHGRRDAIDIGRRERDAAELLRRHVPIRADDRAPAADRSVGVPHRAEVDEEESTVIALKNVVRLHVAMEHGRRERLKIAQDAEELHRHAADLAFIPAPASRDAIGERSARRQLLNEVVRVAPRRELELEVLDVPRDARVAQPGEHARFALEELERLPVAHRAERQTLHREASTAARVLDLVRGGDPAVRDEPHHPVVTHDVARHEVDAHALPPDSGVSKRAERRNHPSR